MATPSQNYVRPSKIQSHAIPYVVQQQTTPQAISQATLQVTPQAMPQAISQVIPQAMPQVIAQSTLQAIPQAIPQSIPQTTPQAIPQAIPLAIPQAIPQTAAPETQKAQRLNIAATIVSITTLVILTVGIATKSWIAIEPGFESDNITLGLWRYCEYRYLVVYGDFRHWDLYYQIQKRQDPEVTRITDRCVFTAAGGVMIGGMVCYGISLTLSLVNAFCRVTRVIHKRNMMIATILLYCVTLVVVIAALGTAGAMGERFISQPVRTHKVVEKTYHDYSIPTWVRLLWSFDVAAIAPFGILITLVLTGISCAEYADKNEVPGVLYIGSNMRGDVVFMVNGPLLSTLTANLPPPNALQYNPRIITQTQRRTRYEVNLDPIATTSI